MDKSPILLLLESSTKVCSVSIASGNKILATEETLEGNKHSEWMTVYIERVIQAASLTMNDIDAIVVSAGPGSYTGLRVAYSVAKGLAFSLSIPMIEADTLTALSNGFLDSLDSSLEVSDIIIPMIDARRMEVYLRAINPIANISTPTQAFILEPDDVIKLLSPYNTIYCIGDGAFKMSQIVLPEDLRTRTKVGTTQCSAAYLLKEGLEKYHSKNWSDVAYCTPFYLKSPNITKSKKKLLA